MENAQKVHFPKKRKWLHHNEQIRIATDWLGQDLTSPLNFLGICSHHVGDKKTSNFFKLI